MRQPDPVSPLSASPTTLQVVLRLDHHAKTGAYQGVVVDDRDADHCWLADVRVARWLARSRDPVAGWPALKPPPSFGPTQMPARSSWRARSFHDPATTT